MTKRGAFRYAGMITHSSQREHQIIPDCHPGISETKYARETSAKADGLQRLFSRFSVNPASFQKMCMCSFAFKISITEQAREEFLMFNFGPDIG